MDVAIEVAIGAFFLAAPWATLALLEARPSPEAATLFRLYGALLVTRGLAHRAVFGVADPRVQRRALHADLFFAVASALALGAAARDGLTGPVGWVVTGLFAAEAVFYAALLTGLQGVGPSDLGRAGTAGPLDSPRA